MIEAVVRRRKNGTNPVVAQEHVCDDMYAVIIRIRCCKQGNVIHQNVMGEPLPEEICIWHRVTRVYVYQNRQPATLTVQILDGARSSSDIVYLSLVNLRSPFDCPSHAVCLGSPI